MCGCGKWHGFGCKKGWLDGLFGSGGDCKCVDCFMERDRDNREGEDDREAVFEHVYFKRPHLLHGKTIGVRVFNFMQKSDDERNDFKVAIFNGNGY